MNIDLRNIREHNGTKAGGFEELVCQLAHLQKPEGALRFVRKEGAGGDAGVECYWVLEDQTDVCWQAKYFIGEMTSSRWRQLDKSFNKALERHPKLTKYFICLPIDKTDIRRTGKDGKKVISVEDEWQRSVLKWIEKAKSQDRTVEFEFWGKHQITSFLTIDDPLYSGKALYWLDAAVLTTSKFEKVVNRAKDALGDRYEAGLHVELPISRNIDGLCLNEQWRKDLGERLGGLKESNDSLLRTLRNQQLDWLNAEKAEELRTMYSEIYRIVSEGLNQQAVLFDVQRVHELLEGISEFHGPIREALDNSTSQKEQNWDYALRNFFNAIDEFNRFLDTTRVKVAEVKAALVYGEAGIGKSHLLCDVSLNRIKNNQPTVFLLGSQYQGGNPIKLIQDAVDLKRHSMGQVLGAIDAAGEASGSRALIVIDALNEGAHREDWHNFISSFLTDVAEYKYIAVLLSCRSTYLRYILPDESVLHADRLVRIEHPGFRGHEHRAAERYLSQQGISKPSSPMLAPEFTNPLFLKTCCKALKASHKTAFPKGFNGITRLFEFYVQSIEETVAKQKRYSSPEGAVRGALLDFASKLFPGHVTGMSMGKARDLINTHDRNPNRGDALFDTLLHEGVLAEEVLYQGNDQGKPVIRFTYERFSDHFVAQQLIQQVDPETLDSIFFPDHPLGKAIRHPSGFYRHAGIFEMLAIVVAEQYGKELVDLLPEDATVSTTDTDDVFESTVVWREPASFTDRTLQLLNQLTGYGHPHPTLDILLKLSTEPEHPWNAELLHRHLLDKEIAERDRFWSTELALAYASEEDDGYESTVRTLIEWASFGDIEEIEEERIRLCSTTLMWFHTTSNRKVRDRSTKALVRILSRFPSLLPDLLQDFHAVNDPYVVERLYAVAYGVICNMTDPHIISQIAALVFDLVFKDGRPPPHILLRDYARGVLECALQWNLLPEGVDAEQFRPPYKSAWPIENPTPEEIDTIVGNERNAWIEMSVMNPFGDFGTYTMACVHSWSPTSLAEPFPETGYDLKKQFAETHLQGEVKARFLEDIQPPSSERQESQSSSTALQELTLDVDEDNLHLLLNSITRPGLQELALDLGEDNGMLEQGKQLRDNISSQFTALREQERRRKEELEEMVKAQLPDDKLEYYRWLSGLRDDGPAQFSRKWAQRWVCKQVYEIGWTEELFSQFDGSYPVRNGRGRDNQEIERVGKKYQWLAFHELLARLSDNVHWVDRDDDPENRSYNGPWQIHQRDIDPTLGISKHVDRLSDYRRVNAWWQPYNFPVADITGFSEQQEFLWDENRLPDFRKFLQVADPVTHNQWSVLRGHWHEDQKEFSRSPDQARLDCWFRINTVFVRNEDLELFSEEFKERWLSEPGIIHVPSTGYEGFLGEYPWHPVYKSISGWQTYDSFERSNLPTYFSPVAEYAWEAGDADHDYSLDESLSFYLPAKELIRSMGLRRTTGDNGSWENDDGVIFRDPSPMEKGPSYALIRSQQLDEWLNNEGLAILWLIGGEKQLFSHNSDRFYGRLTFSVMYRLVDGVPKGGIFRCSRIEPRGDYELL